MPTLLERTKRAALPNTEEAILARQSSKALTRLLERERPPSHHVRMVENETEVEIPDAALPLIAQLLEEMGKGRPVMVLPTDQALTPNQAAEYLGMSRPTLLRLLDNGIIPQHHVGSHRRVYFQDILAFQTEKARQSMLLDELTAQAQELNMGY